MGRYLLTKPRTTLGRSPRSDIVLDETGGVSREHAHILIVDGEVLIEDLSSRNGTFVNGRICQRRTLTHGDRIAIGGYKLRYRHARPAPSIQVSPHERIAALLKKWQPAAMTERFETCPLCRSDVAPDAPDSSDTPAMPDTPDTVDAIDATDLQELVATGPVPHLVAPDPNAGAPSAIVLMPSGMRRPQPEPVTDSAIPSGIASAGDTVDGLFPELFLGAEAGSDTDALRGQQTDMPAAALSPPTGSEPTTQSAESCSDRAERSPGTTRFRRTLGPRRRLQKKRKGQAADPVRA